MNDNLWGDWVKHDKKAEDIPLGNAGVRGGQRKWSLQRSLRMNRETKNGHRRVASETRSKALSRTKTEC